MRAPVEVVAMGVVDYIRSLQDSGDEEWKGPYRFHKELYMAAEKYIDERVSEDAPGFKAHTFQSTSVQNCLVGVGIVAHLEGIKGRSWIVVNLPAMNEYIVGTTWKCPTCAHTKRQYSLRTV